jgi:hypothetical protein
MDSIPQVTEHNILRPDISSSKLKYGYSITTAKGNYRLMIAPTYRQKSEAQKTYDIIHPSHRAKLHVTAM